MSDLKDLAQIIRDNPGCYALVDNDGWSLHKTDPYGPDAPSEEDEQFNDWYEANTLATERDVISVGEGYGSGNCYGGDILQALAQIVGITVESV